jgi:hypothetical protein
MMEGDREPLFLTCALKMGAVSLSLTYTCRCLPSQRTSQSNPATKRSTNTSKWNTG